MDIEEWEKNYMVSMEISQKFWKCLWIQKNLLVSTVAKKTPSPMCMDALM